ncbi:MAG TPA: hypothetical protein DCY57_09915 [Bacteroidetes bacterium]|nr:hypothetical protein [Bacteroidota bacterium]
MGQQQLLLLVMGIIVAAVAVLVGITAFFEKMKQFEADNLISRNLEIATSAVYWKTKKDPFAGGNASYAGLGTDGLPRLHMEAETHHAKYEITSVTASAVVITGNSTRYPDIGVRTWLQDYSIDSTDINYTGAYTVE